MQGLETAGVWVSVSVEWADIEVRVSDHLKPNKHKLTCFIDEIHLWNN